MLSGAEWPFHWGLNLAVPGSSREPITGKYSLLPASPQLPIPCTGLDSLQPGYKWNNCSEVKSPDNKTCWHRTEVSGVICDFHKHEQNQSLAAWSEWREKSDPSSRYLWHQGTTRRTSFLPFFHPFFYLALQSPQTNGCLLLFSVFFPFSISSRSLTGLPCKYCSVTCVTLGCSQG